MSQNDPLERILIAWGQEYGGGRYQWLGYPSESLLHRCQKFGGFMPPGSGPKRDPGKSLSDKVNDAWEQMFNGDQRRLALILQIEYTRRDDAVEAKVGKLAAVGHRLGAGNLQIGARRYYQLLEVAKDYIYELLITARAA